MKYLYFFILVFPSIFINAQNNCDEANSYLVSAYSHVKDAYEANNISHLKYYANRSLESFKLSKKTLTTCGCETALNLADKSIDLLAKVEYAETYEDGRFYVKRARDISKESVIEVDKCSVATNYEDTTEITELSDLQNEQLKLKQQQEALKLKEAQIKAQLAEQKEKQLTLKKKQLISSYKSAIASNVKTYNESLKICNCNHKLIEVNNTSTDLLSNSIEEIKTHYINDMKTMATVYMDTLDSCSTN
ncbi:hypothetical protein MBM09_12485 [Flaviramulus sp. BrNp1-15]|uniref:hypothetical protein n=1 Tax=Flaviramulus sp. BrNp1-15 TaxID=2916754 RepID=UPI001EE8EA13|nr:hypothetical protein [Flaviramulus sp. BrNp1-15]ULC58725.1 hypothetical protein MBM09_12485 [Flaviramulus sp. BrNp1-15]